MTNRPDTPDTLDAPATLPVRVGSLAEHVPDDAPDADAFHPLAGVTALGDVLDVVARERDPAEPEAGSVPLPDHWALLRAVYGGAGRRDLERAHGEPAPSHDVAGGLADRRAADRVANAAAVGRLSAGLHVVTGHTGGGKTGLACEVSRVATLAGHPVVYVSLELDAPELAARVVALHAAAEAERAKYDGELVSWADLTMHRPLSPAARAQRDAALEALREPLRRVYAWAPDPEPGEAPPAVAELRAKVLHAWEAHDRRTPLVVFDYLQAPGIYARDADEERRLSIRERIGAITMQLRHLSKRRTITGEDGTPVEWPGCPVLVLSTTARSNTLGENVPGMDGEDPDKIRHAALEMLKALPKEAGEVEATAVTSWALSLEASDSRVKRLTLRLAKNRKGPAGQWLPLTFDGVTGRIADAPERYAEAARVQVDTDAEGTGGKRNGRRGATTSGVLD